MPSFPAMKRDLEVDVAVVGGGITGVTTGYLLKQSGLSVAVLEKGSLGQGEISHTTAHLTYVTDRRLSKLVDDVGPNAARQAWEAGRTAIDMIEQIVEEQKIDCEFERLPGYLHASWKSNDDDRKSLERDARYADDFGFHAELVDAVPFVGRPGVRFPDQAKFHPYKYLSGLARAVARKNSFVFEETEVDEINDKGELLIVHVGKYKVKARFVVVATHVPLMGKTSLLKATVFQTKLTPYSTYALGAEVEKNAVPQALFWDTSDPYYYLRVDRHPQGDFVIFGGEDHKTGQIDDTNEPYRRLESLLHAILPHAKVTHRWSGQVVETFDGLPYIGETSKGQFVATGFCGNGITFGTVGAIMAVDAAHGRSNPWHDLFSPNRHVLKHPVEYVRENKDYPYYLLKDRLFAGEASSPDELRPGTGKILLVDGRKCAVSRDDDGRLFAVAASCTHMGCLVHWNPAEQTWDCPCHGSRFTPQGTVIAGPAETPLEPVDLHAPTKS
jgi:glycine/D-amino acid oxidase-like deaminating enzyme/nitrite reductase/ring-hydroxylating ferredoxin subunit